MLSIEPTAEFTDLLSQAEKIGYNWNLAHDILTNDGIGYNPDSSSQWFELCEIDEFTYSEDSKKILKSFYEKNKITSFRLLS